MKTESLRDLVSSALSEKTTTYTELYSSNELEERENEFLFFMKPEIVQGVGARERLKILDLIFEAFSSYNMEVGSICILPSEYLNEHRIMAEHYGVIDSTARDAAKNMSQTAINRFKEIYGVSPDEILTLGGFDFLDAYPSIDAAELNKIWAAHEFTRLGGGTYSEKHEVDGRDVVMINAFYPNMLLHYTGSNRKIILFTLRSDTPWKVARGNLLGSTVPSAAKAGSLRNTLLLRKAELGLKDISPTYNGVHLSAGPVEGLVELNRFLTRRGVDDSVTAQGIERFSLGKRLQEHFSAREVAAILENPNLSRGDEKISVFDYTEELDTSPAIERLKEVADQFSSD